MEEEYKQYNDKLSKSSLPVMSSLESDTIIKSHHEPPESAIAAQSETVKKKWMWICTELKQRLEWCSYLSTELASFEENSKEILEFIDGKQKLITEYQEEPFLNKQQKHKYQVSQLLLPSNQ